MMPLSVQHTLYSLSTVVLLVWFWAIPLTGSAFFSTDALADSNTFSIGTVALDVSEATLAASITSTVTDTVEVQLTDSGSIASQYELTASPQACGMNFYNNLEFTVADTNVLYDGIAPGVQATSSNYGTLSFTVGAAPGLQAASSETCTIELSLTSWQTLFTAPQLGFSDTQTIVLTVTAAQAIGAQPTANIVLNEIYPSVLATTTEPLDREWVELYNGTSNPIDVAGWDISEFVGGDTTATERRHTIVADCAGYPVSTHMQPFGTTNTVIQPGGFLVIEFCGSASYLVDSGDTVRLYNAIGAFVDDHTFGATANGKSHARIPDGGTWVDPVPTPGGVNKATRADLEAEGWTETEIVAVLGAAPDAVSSSSTTSQSVDAVASSLPAASSTDGGSTSSFQFATTAVNATQSGSSTSTTTTSSTQSATTTAKQSVSSNTDNTNVPTATTSAATSSATTSPATQPPTTPDITPDPAKSANDDDDESDESSDTDTDAKAKTDQETKNETAADSADDTDSGATADESGADDTRDENEDDDANQATV